MTKIKSLLLLGIAALSAGADRLLGRPRYEIANIAEGTYQTGNMSRLADAALSTRHLLVKFGTDVNHVAVAGAADIPLGVVNDAAEAAEDPVNVQILGRADGTVLMTASAAIAVGAFVVSQTGGKIRTLPPVTGTYYIIGMALEAAAADGDVINVAHCFPIQRVVP